LGNKSGIGGGKRGQRGGVQGSAKEKRSDTTAAIRWGGRKKVGVFCPRAASKSHQASVSHVRDELPGCREVRFGPNRFQVEAEREKHGRYNQFQLEFGSAMVKKQTKKHVVLEDPEKLGERIKTN